jgi:hypothetical protein
VIVDIECVCGHHEQDRVVLRDALDFRRAMTIVNAAMMAKQEDPDGSSAELVATLSEQYLLVGIESWSLRGADRKPLPVTSATIRDKLLSRPLVAVVIAEAADDLYSQAVVLPLLLKAARSSQPGQTNGSTSPRTGSRRKRPTPSSPSSTESSQMAATAMTT